MSDKQTTYVYHGWTPGTPASEAEQATSLDELGREQDALFARHNYTPRSRFPPQRARAERGLDTPPAVAPVLAPPAPSALALLADPRFKDVMGRVIAAERAKARDERAEEMHKLERRLERLSGQVMALLGVKENADKLRALDERLSALAGVVDKHFDAVDKLHSEIETLMSSYQRDDDNVIELPRLPKVANE